MQKEAKDWTFYLLQALMFVTVFFSGSMTLEAGEARPIAPGQTEGFANGELVVFDYTENFICANAPLNDMPCVLGDFVTNPNADAVLEQLRLDPDEVPDLIVIVPFFDTDGDGTLDALEDPSETDPEDMVFVQCPETQSTGGSFGTFGHCILHDTAFDTAPLDGVMVSGVTFGGVIPLPNHSHIVDETPGGDVPWDTDVVLVLNPEHWPDKDGICAAAPCPTSFEAIFDSDLEQGQDIIGPIDSTLFLFFGVHNLDP